MWLTQTHQLGHWNRKYLQKVVLLCPRHLLSVVHSKARFHFPRSFLILLSRLAPPQEGHIGAVVISPVWREERLLMSLTGQSCLLKSISPLCVSARSHLQACGWLWSCCPVTSTRSGRTFLTWWTDRPLWLVRWAFQKSSCQVGWNAVFVSLLF